ncbi:MAG: Adenine phosphoribosyltransferase [Gemmatimonadaceae bacterium]|nr:Adenine phosphoribosyltransferase [Gemmatimonadaceae bacterium]
MASDFVGRLRAAIRDVPDYPKPGIVFRDITPLLGDAVLFRRACEAMADAFRSYGVTHVIAIESRGFIFGGVIAERLGAGFVPVRKVGRLPYKTERVEYALEYGSDVLEMHIDALGAGSRALVVDDLLATGGTAAATISLARQMGADVIGCSFLIRLGFLSGLQKIGDVRTESLIVFED